jgi:hypothetical protein
MSHIKLSWRSIPILVGAAETIEMVKGRERYTFVSLSQGKVIYYARNKTESMDERRAYKEFTLELIKKESPNAAEYKANCIMGWEFAHRIQELYALLREHKEADRSADGELAVAQLVVWVLWSGILAPICVPVHSFYKTHYFAKKGKEIQENLQYAGFPVEVLQ